jgi:hypothetical protein
VIDRMSSFDGRRFGQKVWFPSPGFRDIRELKEARSKANRDSIDTSRLRMSRISSFYFGATAMYRKMTGIECNATI